MVLQTTSLDTDSAPNGVALDAEVNLVYYKQTALPVNPIMSVAPNTRSIATLRSITDATRTLLASQDYDSLSMRAVAAEAGVSPGAIYKHFSNKRHLVDHVCHG